MSQGSEMPDEIREIDSQSAVRQLWDYHDAELDDQRMVEVRQHLLTCKRCLPHAEFGRRFIQALSRARERHFMPPAVRSQVMSALAQAGFSEE
jgi:hypothetical protein